MPNDKTTPPKIKPGLKTIRWVFGLAWSFNSGLLVLWLSLSIVLSVMPAIALGFNREVLAGLSGFLSGMDITYAQIVPKIVLFGIVLTLMGISNRINRDMIGLIMYDSYSVGLQEFMMDRVQKIGMTEFLNKEFFDEYHGTGLSNRSLNEFISSFCELLGKLVGVASLLAVAFTVSPVIFCFSIVYIAVVLFINSRFSNKRDWDYQEYLAHERKAEYFERMPRQPGAAKEIRIYKNTPEVVSQWKKAFGEILNYNKSRGINWEFRAFAGGMGFYVFLIIIVVYAVFRVAAGTMDAAVLLLIYTMCNSIYSLIDRLTDMTLSTGWSLHMLERLRRFYTGERFEDSAAGGADKTDEKLDGDVVFELRNVDFSYDGKVKALSNINLTVRRGETIALVGLNGSGKTTLTKILLELYKPDAGEVLLFGRPYREYREDFLRKNVNTFFQDVKMAHQTVALNVGFGDVDNVDDRAKVLAAIDKGGASKVVEKLPNGVETMLMREIYSSGVILSGGETQRVGLSRAHMSDKDILVFDEPASMLDPIAEMEQFMNIKEKLMGRTAVLISHRVGFARLADRVVVMDAGSIIEDGTHETLMEKGGVYADFFRNQAEWYNTVNS